MNTSGATASRLVARGPAEVAPRPAVGAPAPSCVSRGRPPHARGDAPLALVAPHSRIYRGHVIHVRRSPRRHAFRIPLYMLYLDLDELEWLKHFGLSQARFGWLSFRREDYFRPAVDDLRSAVWDAVEAEVGPRRRGPVRLLTHVRSLGYVFNPVSFYYCFRPDGALDAVLAEITNTPWGERHHYVLHSEAEDATAIERRFPKAFHVSPFFPMSQQYRWRLGRPGQELRVSMANTDESGATVFRAALRLRAHPMNRQTLRRTLIQHPAMSLKVHAAIYGHAFALWAKKTPFFSHPKHRRNEHESA